MSWSSLLAWFGLCDHMWVAKGMFERDEKVTHLFECTACGKIDYAETALSTTEEAEHEV